MHGGLLRELARRRCVAACPSCGTHWRLSARADSRTGDPSFGEFENAVVLAQFGEVDLNALSE
jgi:hypothetical protein